MSSMLLDILRFYFLCVPSRRIRVVCAEDGSLLELEGPSAEMRGHVQTPTACPGCGFMKEAARVRDGESVLVA
jgi:hypothetical protein